MLNKELISTSIPSIHYNDKVADALEMMNQARLSQLPVLEDNKFLGLVFEDDLLNEKESEILSSLPLRFSNARVSPNSYYLHAVQVVLDYKVRIVPVVEKDRLLGVIQDIDLLSELAKQTGVQDPGGIIVLSMDNIDFSFSEISRLVETNDAQITQLNTYRQSHPPSLMVVLRVNKFEISAIVATFQRYDYNVQYYFGDEKYENELKSNYDHLMNYLNL